MCHFSLTDLSSPWSNLNKIHNESKKKKKKNGEVEKGLSVLEDEFTKISKSTKTTQNVKKFQSTLP